jgi:Na+/phosphate symporter
MNQVAVGAGALRNSQPMFQTTLERLALAWDGFRRQDVTAFETVAPSAGAFHRRENSLTEAIVTGPSHPEGDVFSVPSHLERIGHSIESLMAEVRTMLREGIPFTDRAMREINSLFERAVELVECARDAVMTENRILIRHIVQQGTQYAQLADDYALAHQQRLVEGICMTRASTVYLAILDDLKGIERHTRQIAQRLSVSRAA